MSLTCERAGLNICAFISPLISMGMRLPLRTREKEVCPEDDVTAVQCIQLPVIKQQEFGAYLSTATAGKLPLGWGQRRKRPRQWATALASTGNAPSLRRPGRPKCHSALIEDGWRHLVG
jgi:hypothetical protein